MWICKAESLAREPLSGIGPGPFTDEEFGEAVTRYEAQFSADQVGAVARSGLYEHVATGSGPEPSSGEPRLRKGRGETEGD